MNRDERIVAGIWNVFNKMVCLNKRSMEERLRGYKSSEVHCIEHIGKNEDINVTKIADAFYMTRGAASKITKKLIDKNIIESYRKPENKKEIYFRLTAQGKTVYEMHEALHQSFRLRDKVIFDGVSEEQLNDIIGFMERYSSHLDAEMSKMDTADMPGKTE